MKFSNLLVATTASVVLTSLPIWAQEPLSINKKICAKVDGTLNKDGSCRYMGIQWDTIVVTQKPQDICHITIENKWSVLQKSFGMDCNTVLQNVPKRKTTSI